MTVHNGRKFLSIPGPTTVPDAVLNAMHQPAVDIYTGALVDVTARCQAGLKKVFATAGRTYIYACNGHGAWEAALTNVLSRGDKVLVLESGRFAVGWGEMADVLGVEVLTLNAQPRRAVDPATVTARLQQADAADIKAVLVVQIDTASGVVNDIPAIRAAIDAAGHDALFMVDAIASLGTMPFEMDAWRVDVAVTGSQKGLMMSPGLGFVAAAGKALDAHEQAGLRTHYWDWTAREGPEHYHKYCGTPPEHMLFGLDRAFDILFEEGLENVFRRHRILAEAVQAAVEVWSRGQALSFNITEPDERSPSVTTVLMDDGRDPNVLRKFCEDTCGVTLGSGIGDLSGKGFRIAHMGHVNAPMVLGTLGATEVGLRTLEIPHGEGGVQAAVEVIASKVAA